MSFFDIIQVKIYRVSLIVNSRPSNKRICFFGIGRFFLQSFAEFGAGGDEDGGFIGGQVFKYTGFVSAEGSFDSERENDDHIVIVTYWNSFEQHEKSHADKVFRERFEQLTEFCSETYEIGYEMLWQGMPEEQELRRSA